MMRIPAGYEYADFADIIETEYRLSPDDQIGAQIFTNDGAGMINIGGSSGGGSTGLTFRIEYDGFVKLPLYGRVYLQGLTIRQAEMLLEDKLSEFYNNPFVLLTVNNRRVLLFAGDNSQVVRLVNDNTTLFEVLAESGGIPSNGRARRVKIIRGDLSNPQIYKIDLSTLSGITAANLVMQGNDIIYIETRDNYVTKVLSELAPYIAVLSTVISTAAIISQLRVIGQ
jgi:polysaccharide export outer membrane protein